MNEKTTPLKRKIKENNICEEPNTAEKQSKMSTSQTKTSITILQEICAKQSPKEVPLYEELLQPSSEYDNQGMKFFTRVSALGREAVGGGVTKKIAKHTAAENLLKKFFCNDADNDDDNEMQSRKCVEKDSISELMDYCTLKDYHKPSFDCISSCGPSHAPSFTFQCKLNSIVRTATAGNKKLAKQLAADEVLKIIKTSFPDMEKKIAKVNDTQGTENVRQKISSYLELRTKNKADSMGTSIKERHKFFRAQDEEFVAALTKILHSADLSDQEKYEKLLEELKTMWPYKIDKFADTDLMKFELEIDYEKFTCLLIGTEVGLKNEVLEYFKEMLKVYNFDPAAIQEEKQSVEELYFQRI